MDTLAYALSYLRAGISVIPVLADGSKRPALTAWNPYRVEPATEAQVDQWFGKPHPPGIALLCGRISGGLELIDFDWLAAEIFPKFRAMVEDGWPGLLNRVCLIKTPRRPAGYHVWLRCGDIETPGNMVLASLSSQEVAAEKALAEIEKRKAETKLIETRGEGGYGLVPGCRPECHESRACYTHIAGGKLWELNSISMDERDFLMSCARSFDRAIPPPEPIPRSVPGNDLRPGDHFDREGDDWADILQAQGWSLAYGSVGGERRWRRPGKDHGWSATTGHCQAGGADLLRVFSSNADPFEEGKSYGKFRAWSLLNTNGDLSRAARDLRNIHGFGKPVYGTAKKAAPAAQETPAPSETEQAREVATISDLARAGAEITWVWEQWIPRGVLVAVAAEGGTGKTRFVADLMRRIAHGLPWPDGSAMTLPPDSMALWVVADNHHDEMVTLARSFGIEKNIRVNAWSDDPYAGVSLEAPEDFRELELRIQKVKPAFVVVDTVGNATDRSMSRQEDARAFYMPLQIIARRNRTTVLALTHLNSAGKFLGRRVMEKVRLAIRMEKPDPDDPRRALEVVKSNSKTPVALGVTMKDECNEYDYEPPKAPPMEPGQEGFAERTRASRGRPAVSIGPATQWLQNRLENGPARVSVIRREAEDLGHSTGTLYKAKEAAGAVESVMDGYKFWSIGVSDDGATPFD